MKLFQEYDGANYQARAVLAFLAGHDHIEGSWDVKRSAYRAEPTVARWYNCREQGYVVSLTTADYRKQINIAFFEHRNSDSICAVEFEAVTTNPPTIDTITEDMPVYKDKCDVSHTVRPGQASKMADWIFNRLEQYWNTHSKIAKAD